MRPSLRNHTHTCCDLFVVGGKGRRLTAELLCKEMGRKVLVEEHAFEALVQKIQVFGDNDRLVFLRVFLLRQQSVTNGRRNYKKSQNAAEI